MTLVGHLVLDCHRHLWEHPRIGTLQRVELKIQNASRYVRTLQNGSQHDVGYITDSLSLLLFWTMATFLTRSQGQNWYLPFHSSANLYQRAWHGEFPSENASEWEYLRSLLSAANFQRSVLLYFAFLSLLRPLSLGTYGKGLRYFHFINKIPEGPLSVCELSRVI